MEIEIDGEMEIEIDGETEMDTLRARSASSRQPGSRCSGAEDLPGAPLVRVERSSSPLVKQTKRQ